MAMNTIKLKFPDERTARRHIETRRWHGRPTCPHCGRNEKIRRESRDGTDGYYRCSVCMKVFTVRTESIFARSHVPLDKWLQAIRLAASFACQRGISSPQLAYRIGVTQKTAWRMLNRIYAARANRGGEWTWWWPTRDQ